jgi:DNA polymerase delta subunit 1
VKLVHKANIYGYAKCKDIPFVLISATSPSHLNAIKKLLETSFGFGRFSARSYPTFESNMPIVLRFMVDAKIAGMNWVEAPAGTYSLRSAAERTSSCQYEIDIRYTAS